MYAVEFCKMAQISVFLCYQHATNISEFNVHPSQDTENNFCSGMHNANAHHVMRRLWLQSLFYRLLVFIK